MAVSIAQVTAEHHHDGLGLSTPTPRLSWRFNGTSTRAWRQQAYKVQVIRAGACEEYHVDSTESVLVPWPSTPLSSRERVVVKVSAIGEDGVGTDWATLAVEAALFDRTDWTAKMISCPPQEISASKRPFRLRHQFHLTAEAEFARLYCTAYGIYEVEINGRRVGDHVLAPGWQSYNHRLHYQVHDVTRLLRKGENVIGVYVGEGWYAGRLGRPGVSNIWGERLGFLGQLEVDGRVICATDTNWDYLEGPVLSSEIYNGEVYDTNLSDPRWSTESSTPAILGKAEELDFPKVVLVSPEVAPVRKIMEVKAKQILTTPTGKKVLDFGQNLVGWLRIEVDVRGKGELCLKHAEVMEHGELGVRPLRTAQARDTLVLGGPTKGWEPKFTFHGFRYVEVTGHDSVSINDFTAIVISSDLRRTGTFECSHKFINQLHENTVWSMRGNFVSVPTDCPQRDERLGWTGDIQVFAPTANFLYDTSGFLNSWLDDLAVEQQSNNSIVPIVIPNIPMTTQGHQNRPMAVWADCVVITPWDLYQSFGDREILRKMWSNIVSWLDHGVPRDADGFYSTVTPQFGDWLDPRSPPALPGNSPTDPYMVANAYLVYTTDLASKIGAVLGEGEKAAKYSDDAKRLTKLFKDTYVTPRGRLACDTQTAYSLALKFGLADPKQIPTLRSRLDYLIRWEAFKITTGFVGTPIILDVLAENGMLDLAYRMLQERDEPSWLYPIRMGATTIWERWNSMLPDGSINPGQMTSFNHYALGSVCAFLHRVIGGLSPAVPGWKRALVYPQPGGTVRHAKTSYDSPYGLYEVDWSCEGSRMTTCVKVPPNGEARVVLEGVDEIVYSGEYKYETRWIESPAWPPQHIQGPQVTITESHFVP